MAARLHRLPHVMHAPAATMSNTLPPASSIGLPTRTAVLLAYSGWWITGAIFWFLERRDPVVRFHAAQAVVVFGLLAGLMGLCGVLAAASLSFVPSLFGPLLAAAGVVWVAGVVLWAVVMWRTATGGDWRIRVAARWAERLARV